MTKQFRVKRKDIPAIPFEITFEQVQRDVNGEAVLGDDDAPVLTEVTEKFMARGEIPGMLMMEIAGGRDPSEQVAGMIRFLSDAIVPEDRQRFTDILRNSDPPIDAEQLGGIAEWLVEVYGEQRPTG